MEISEKDYIDGKFSGLKDFIELKFDANVKEHKSIIDRQDAANHRTDKLDNPINGRVSILEGNKKTILGGVTVIGFFWGIATFLAVKFL